MKRFAIYYSIIFILSIFLSGFGFVGCDKKSGSSVTNDSVVTETVDEDLVEEYADEIAEIIKNSIDTIAVKKYFTDKDIRHYLYEEFGEFYTNRNYQLAWYTSKGPLAHTEELLQALAKAPEEGLEYDYRIDKIRALQQKVFENPLDLGQLAKLDFLTSSAYLTYASHLLSGVVDPNRFDITWIALPRQLDLALYLQDAIQQGNIKQSFAHLVPKHKEYAQLKKALIQYKEIAKLGGWPTLPADTVLRKGDSSQAVLILRQRLELTGDLVNSIPTTVFEEQLENALLRYQQRNGLKADGIFGPNTAHVMNIPVEKRIGQIQLNMERLRWWPESFGDKYVLVNVPEYKVKVFEEEKKVMEMKVIVGEKYNSTPIFRDTIQYVVFSPTWTVPLSIASEEILPILKRNPGYLARNNMKVYDGWNRESSHELNPYRVNWKNIAPSDFNYRIVQQPGPSNPLGLVKFMFPNDLAIYLHDTPAEHLFDKKRRDFSHGCVRVERPVDLAAYLLADDDKWDRQRIMEYMHKDSPVWVSLQQPIPVQFVYRTAFVDDKGIVNFRKDVYQHDTLQLNAIPL